MRSAHRKQSQLTAFRVVVTLGILLCVIGVSMSFSALNEAASGDAKTIPQATATQPPIAQSAPAIADSISPTAVEPSVVPPPTVITNPIPAKADPIRIDIPDAKISSSVSLLPLSDSQKQRRNFTPPNDPAAYWSDRFDRPGGDSTDLTFISGHACEGLAICNTIDWQFSRLSDENLVKTGTAISVFTKNGEVCYRVDNTPVTYEKDSLQNQVAVFGDAPRPGKLVLVSSYMGSIHERDIVVIATMRPCGS